MTINEKSTMIGMRQNRQKSLVSMKVCKQRKHWWSCYNNYTKINCSRRILWKLKSIVEFLPEKYKDKLYTAFVLREIATKELLPLQTEVKLKDFKTTDSSNMMLVMVFSPFFSVIKASAQLHICEECHIWLWLLSIIY